MDKISLLEKEEILLKIVESFNLHSSYENRKECLQASKELTISLLNRKVIPASRINYFKDRNYSTSKNRKSIKEVFESNGTKGFDIFSHPHFIKHLLYFIYGANVSSYIEEYAIKSVKNKVYCSDAVDEIFEFIKKNRILRDNRISKNDLAEEIFKLMIDLNVELYEAKRIRELIMNLK